MSRSSSRELVRGSSDAPRNAPRWRNVLPTRASDMASPTTLNTSYPRRSFTWLAVAAAGHWRRRPKWRGWGVASQLSCFLGGRTPRRLPCHIGCIQSGSTTGPASRAALGMLAVTHTSTTDVHCRAIQIVLAPAALPRGPNPFGFGMCSHRPDALLHAQRLIAVQPLIVAAEPIATVPRPSQCLPTPDG